MRVKHRAALLSAVVALLALPALPAAAATAPLPETKLKVKSIDWQPRSGNVEVTARVKCTGEGTFRWDVRLEQGRTKDQGSANVPCDGDGFFSTILLEPRTGRFHPGIAALSTGGTVIGDGMGAAWVTVQGIRLDAR